LISNGLNINTAISKEIRVRRIEELSLNAWPSLKSSVYDGWLLRSSEGYTKRANSINMLYAPHLAIQEKMAYVKTYYRDRNLPTIYKIIPELGHATIDATLAASGYERIDTTHVMTLKLERDDFNLRAPKLSQGLLDKGLCIEINEILSERWLKGFMQASNTADDKASIVSQMINGIAGKTIFVTCCMDDKAIGFGYGVIEMGHVGLFDIVVHPSFRKRQIGKYIVSTVLDTAKKQNAHTAYLQVVAGNKPAEELYKGFGFETLYQYWYRK